MEQYIKIGIGVMILDENKILLGHRAKDKENKSIMKHSLKEQNVK